MSTILNNFEMKIVYFIRTLIFIIAGCFLVSSAWLIIFKNFYQEPLMFFPLILSIGLLSNIYRLSRVLKINKGVLNRLQIKYYLLGCSRAAFVSVAYLGFVIHNILNAIFFTVLAIVAFVCEIIIIRSEYKKGKNTMTKIRLIYILTFIVGILSLGLIICGLWLYYTNGSQLLGALFPMLWGGVGIYNVYKIIMCIQNGKGFITSRQVRVRFFSYARGTLASLTYIFAVAHNIKNAIWMGIFTILMFAGEILVNHLETKAVKNDKS